MPGKCTIMGLEVLISLGLFSGWQRRCRQNHYIRRVGHRINCYKRVNGVSGQRTVWRIDQNGCLSAGGYNADMICRRWNIQRRIAGLSVLDLCQFRAIIHENVHGSGGGSNMKNFDPRFAFGRRAI